MLITDKYKQFARDLVITQELDPMYDFMHASRIANHDEWADKYALYLFMFYDARAAVEAADAKSFWAYTATHYEAAKRGTERRHFRGKKGWDAIERLSNMGEPTDVWRAMYRDNYADLYYNIEANFEGCQIGEYFRWKAMDIFDRTMGLPVKLSMPVATTLLPESPRKCAKSVYPNYALKDVLADIVSWIDDLIAPGAPTRNCGIPEAETIMCAIRGLEKGTYKFGEDIDLRHEQMKGMFEAVLLPRKQDWKQYGPY
jgi:hypothetical protein